MAQEITRQPGFFARSLAPPRAVQWLWLWSFIGIVSFIRVFLHRYMPVGDGMDAAGYHIGHDFVNMWTGAKLALANKAEAVFSLNGFMAEMRQLLDARAKDHVFSYPPHLLVMIAGLGLMPYFPALIVWTVLGLGLWGFAVCKNGHVKISPATLLLLALSPVSIINCVIGQNGYFTGALFLAGLYLSEKSPVKAGILIGMLTFKPHLGILIPFVLLARRNWKCFIAAGVTTLALVGLSLLFWGIEPWRLYVANTLPLQRSLLEGNMGFYIAMMPGIYINVLLMPDPGIVEKALWIFMHAAAAIWAFFSSLQAAKTEGMSPRAVLMLSLAALLITPYGFDYDMTAIAGALVVYILSAEPTPVPRHIILGMLWALPLTVIEMKLGRLPFSGFIMLAAFAALALQRMSASSKSV